MTPENKPKGKPLADLQPELLTPEELPAKKKVALFRAEKFEGPLPPPVILKEYGEIDNTFPNRIVSMAESRLSHTQKMEWWAMWTFQALNALGKIFGFLIGFGALAGGYYLISQGRDVTGFILAFAGLAPLIGAYIWSEIQKRAAEAKDEKPEK